MIFRRISDKTSDNNSPNRLVDSISFVYKYLKIFFLTIVIFYLSLIISSPSVGSDQEIVINRAISILEAKGFTKEVIILRHFTVFRNTDNWLNSSIGKENAFASTNFPFGIITIYPDFITKASDDTERAMILLHEAQHLQGKNEKEAYGYVWQNRQKLGWTLRTHGSTETFVTIELQTRENSPELFTCSDNLWKDCTEMTKPREKVAKK